jgi:hypothetical protein
MQTFARACAIIANTNPITTQRQSRGRAIRMLQVPPRAVLPALR